MTEAVVSAKSSHCSQTDQPLADVRSDLDSGNRQSIIHIVEFPTDVQLHSDICGYCRKVNSQNSMSRSPLKE